MRDSEAGWDDDRSITRHHIALARILIGALAAGSLLAQFVVVPQIAADAAERYPEVAYLEIPYLTAVVVALAFFELALLAAWRLTARRRRQSLTNGSQRWIDVMTASLCLSALTVAGICVHAGSIENIGGPAMLLGLVAGLALIAAVVVLRSKAARIQAP
ncbi:DUF2975 domain-containing protein [Arthrobacter sp. EH-1B-1]|uniref:DUF2975 domain-containing protein n=1 Tax=Arthrobacter vasquezii TaxID=2977629 RepID=A0ABT6CXQ9_9MICC|nr:DUF2975 domain-containing protein [Arthrobacter vasquezii]MDF9278653.1 DUF2975 domain-containing protein [Arthrobacter vasquezii]